MHDNNMCVCIPIIFILIYLMYIGEQNVGALICTEIRNAHIHVHTCISVYSVSVMSITYI